MEGTQMFWKEANPDISVSSTNSVFAKSELVHAFLKNKKIHSSSV